TADHRTSDARGIARRTKSAITAPDSAPSTRSAGAAPLVMRWILRGWRHLEALERHGKVATRPGWAADLWPRRAFTQLRSCAILDDQLPVLRLLAVRSP